MAGNRQFVAVVVIFHLAILQLAVANPNSTLSDSLASIGDGVYRRELQTTSASAAQLRKLQSAVGGAAKQSQALLLGLLGQAKALLTASKLGLSAEQSRMSAQVVNDCMSRIQTALHMVNKASAWASSSASPPSLLAGLRAVRVQLASTHAMADSCVSDAQFFAPWMSKQPALVQMQVMQRRTKSLISSALDLVSPVDPPRGATSGLKPLAPGSHAGPITVPSWLLTVGKYGLKGTRLIAGTSGSGGGGVSAMAETTTQPAAAASTGTAAAEGGATVNLAVLPAPLSGEKNEGSSSHSLAQQAGQKAADLAGSAADSASAVMEARREDRARRRADIRGRMTQEVRRRLPGSNVGAQVGASSAIIPAFSGAAPAWLKSLKPNVTVAKDGSGQFKTITDALKSAPASSSTRYVIYVKSGVYKDEGVTVNSVNVTLVGDGIGKTIVTGSMSVAGGATTYSSATFAIQGDYFTAVGITFQNTAGISSMQAVALRINADLAAFYGCSFEGFQDTIFAAVGRHYFAGCTVTGTVDFVFGMGATILDYCTIIMRKFQFQDVIAASGRTLASDPGGIIVVRSRILGETTMGRAATQTFPNGYPQNGAQSPFGIVGYFARPWKNQARSVFMYNEVDQIISPSGFLPWGNSTWNGQPYYMEFASYGQGALSFSQKRVSWANPGNVITPFPTIPFYPLVYLGSDFFQQQQ